MKAAFENVTARFQRLSLRERRLVILAAALLLILLWWWLVAPLWSGTARLSAQLAERQRLLAELEAAREQAAVLRTQGGAAPVQGQSESLVLIVDRTSRSAGLGDNLRNSQPTGTQRLQVNFENAAFNAVVAWLAELQQHYGIGIESATIDSAGSPGRVNVTLGLARL